MKIKHPDRPDYFSLGHFMLGVLAGLTFLWYPIAGIIAFATLVIYEFVENYLTEKGTMKIWLVRLDPHGVSILDIVFDLFGFCLMVYAARCIF